ncbi:uncharacterized protein LOC131250719 [Magnolia sinica]|uniref:uncharacterized protein LOC131250719 n=1 Tax=Magnolia sinica TaxID=86752 RepID=UPI002659B8F6|nr:uncharacterized protein LOC131250719 [Magnolia sinica]
MDDYWANHVTFPYTVMDDDDDVGGVPLHHVRDPDTGNLDDDDDVGDPDPLDDDDDDVRDPDPLDDDDDDVEDEDEGEGEGNVDDSEGVPPLEITPIFDTEPTESTDSDDEIDENPPE